MKSDRRCRTAVSIALSALCITLAAGCTRDAPVLPQWTFDSSMIFPSDGSLARPEDGAALADSRTRKERRYPELCQGNRCRLVVTGMKVGGRWSEEAFDFLSLLASAKAKETPGYCEAARTTLGSSAGQQCSQ